MARASVVVPRPRRPGGAGPRAGGGLEGRGGAGRRHPGHGVWFAGYGTRRPPDGKLRDLWMKALALEDHKGNRAVRITGDFQDVPTEMSDRVFEQLRAKYKLDRRQVMLTFSHSRSWGGDLSQVWHKLWLRRHNCCA